MTAATRRIVIPGVIITGVVIWYMYSKKNAAATDISNPDSGTIEDAAPPPPPPVYNTGLDSTLVNDVITHQNETELTSYYNTVYSLPSSVFAKIQPTMALLRSQGKTAELKACADYITHFLSLGLPLTRAADTASLYDQIVSIHNTYGIF